jgi:hypothetical protein
MKTKQTTIPIILVMGLFIITCDKESPDPLSLSGNMISHSACKNELKSSSHDLTTPDSISCIAYSYDMLDHKLSVQHVNAGFNCCPESLYCDIALHGDTILIREYESAAQCRCNCLYDLDIVVTSVEAKKYKVRFVEPYAGEQEQLLFSIDLEIEWEGSFCVIRKQYPWGVNTQ